MHSSIVYLLKDTSKWYQLLPKNNTNNKIYTITTCYNVIMENVYQANLDRGMRSAGRWMARRGWFHSRQTDLWTTPEHNLQDSLRRIPKDCDSRSSERLLDLRHLQAPHRLMSASSTWDGARAPQLGSVLVCSWKGLSHQKAAASWGPPTVRTWCFHYISMPTRAAC